MLPAVRVQNLGKSFRLGVTHSGSLRELVNRATSRLTRRSAPATNRIPDQPGRVASDGLFWALRDVSFDVEPGQVVGVIGRNGAGKSTLLKILSRITYPSTGRVEINGRVASLLEVGTGFHPELTGRENVFLNGTILGMTKREVARSFDEIVAFAEVDKFIDTPVKRYSSGMHVRLAFAVAAHLQPEILFVDEVLAVGDASFQQKCLAKMSDLGNDGRTILFVSHNMGAVRQLTTECVVIHDGGVLFRGPSDQAVDRYLDQQRSAARVSTNVVDLPRMRWAGDRSVEFVDVDIVSPSTRKLMAGQHLQIGATVRAKQNVASFAFSVTIYKNDGEPLATAFGDSVGAIDAGSSRTYQLEIPDGGFAPGSYWLSMAILRNSRLLVDAIQEVGHFDVLQDGKIPSGFTQWIDQWGDLRIPMSCTANDHVATVAPVTRTEVKVGRV
jgi:lipopolysaccharide transport system ATP-binding protein